jgi:hypothetical protein
MNIKAAPHEADGIGGTGMAETRDPDDLALRARMADDCRARDRAEAEAAAELAEPEPPTEEDVANMYLDWRRDNPYGTAS